MDNIHLPNEMLNEIVVQTDPKDLLNLTITSKTFRELCLEKIQPIESEIQLKRSIYDGDLLRIIHSRDFIINGPHLDTILIMASMFDYREIVEFAIEQGAIDLSSALSAACGRGYIEIVKLLIDKGADVSGGGAFIIACEHGHREIAQLMNENGATPSNGSLVAACCGGHLEVVKLLLESGKIENPDLGREVARYAGHQQILNLLSE